MFSSTIITNNTSHFQLGMKKEKKTTQNPLYFYNVFISFLRMNFKHIFFCSIGQSVHEKSQHNRFKKSGKQKQSYLTLLN